MQRENAASDQKKLIMFRENDSLAWKVKNMLKYMHKETILETTRSLLRYWGNHGLICATLLSVSTVQRYRKL